MTPTVARATRPAPPCQGGENDGPPLGKERERYGPPLTKGGLGGGVFCMLFFVLAAPARADTAADILQQAESAFTLGIQHKAEPDAARKHFKTSAELFHNLYEQGYHSVELCRDWGQAEFLADQLPQAIFAWRLGLREAPADRHLLANLEVARDQVEYPPGNLGRPTASLWPASLPWLSFPTLVLATLAAYALLCASATVWLIARRPGLLTLAGMCLVSVALLAGWATAVGIGEQESRRYAFVVLARDHTLRRGNGSSYPAHDKIPVARAGMEARLLFDKGEWVQIEFAGGHVGWVRRSFVLIEPAE